MLLYKYVRHFLQSLCDLHNFRCVDNDYIKEFYDSN